MKATAVVAVATLILLLTATLAISQVISGVFVTDVDLRLQSPSLTIRSLLSINYTLGDWQTGVNASLSSKNFLESLTFLSNGSLGTLDASTGVHFMTAGIPGIGTFPLGYAYAWADLRFNFGGIATTISVDNSVFPFGRLPVVEDWPCAGLAPYTTLALVVQYTEYSAFLRLGQCCEGPAGLIDFSGAVDDVSFCCGLIDAEIYFTCSGFEHLRLGVQEVELPSIPFLTLDAEICFEVESKTLTLSPALDFGPAICLDVYVTSDSGGGLGPLGPVLTIGDVSIAGIGLECRIGGVSFAGVSYWGAGEKPGILAATPYWEAYEISTLGDACCGDFEFSVAVFFDGQSNMLFDWAELRAEAAIVLGPNFSVRLEIAATDSGLQGLDVGFTVSF